MHDFLDFKNCYAHGKYPFPPKFKMSVSRLEFKSRY